jgi:hypothetical protein
MSIQLFTGASNRLKTRLSTITQSVFTRFQCSIWQNDFLAKPQSAANRSTCNSSIQLFTGATKRLKIDFRWQISSARLSTLWAAAVLCNWTKLKQVLWVTGRLCLSQFYAFHDDWAPAKCVVCVCVWSVVILTPLSARADAVINLPSQISIV